MPNGLIFLACSRRESDYNDLTVIGTLNNTGADLALTGEIGTAEKGAVVTTNGGSLAVIGAVHSYRIDMQNGNVAFHHHDRENPLEVNKVVLKTTSSNYFQTYGGMKIGSMQVEGDARVDGYAKTKGEMYDIPIEIGDVWVKEKGSLTFSNTVRTGQSDATVGTIVLIRSF